jgi:hypothetical protein
MKLAGHLKTFLENTVNINQTRVDTLTARVEAVKTFLKASEVFKDFYVNFVPQGSYAHKTIIKPSSKKPEFDADVLLYLKPNDEWEPKDYIEELYATFRASGTYRDKVKRQSRCVMLDFAGEFSLDVVPCILRRPLLIFEEENVVNRLTNEEEPTKPRHYTKWFLDKDKTIGNQQVVKVVRLAKYLRDIKQTFSVKSILLTTLMGMQIDDFDDDNVDKEFCDLPTSLKTMFNRLNDWLQARPEMPTVTNPVLDEEDFNRHWNQDKYENFRNQWDKYTGWINDAYDEEDKDESILMWRKVFGDCYAKDVVVDKASILVDSIVPVPAYCERPPWTVMNFFKPEIKITAHKNQQSPAMYDLSKYTGALNKGLHIRMEYLGQLGQGYDLCWQVVNTGKEAELSDDLRGKIFRGQFVRWENTKYRGTHWVECFIVDRKKQICTGRSGRVFVNVK